MKKPCPKSLKTAADVSRKGAKAQRNPLETRQRFASLRLCGRLFGQSLLKVSVFTLLPLAATAMAQTNSSVYTPLAEKQCRTVKAVDPMTNDYEGRCRGVAGYALIVTEGDLRQNVTVVTPKGAKHSLELWDVISGGFSSVGPKAEWRMAKQNGKLTPVALIIRYNANDDPESPNKQSSYLAVTKITPTEICVTDKIMPGAKANEEARQAADAAASKPCLKRSEQ